MTAMVVRGDARRLPLPDASVDLIVTSPPYWSLRSYTDGGEHYVGQVGAEATPGEYIAELVACTREWMRVLKPGGSIFVNLGDKYSDRANGGPASAESNRADRAKVRPPQRSSTGTAPAKSLLLLPERYRIACVDQLGLIVRAVVVWEKPNGMPDSVKDRVRRSHEDWVHLVKEPVYYSAVDAIRETLAGPARLPGGGGTYRTMRSPGARDTNLATAMPHPLGKLPGSVWPVATSPLTVPQYLVERDGRLVEWIADDTAAWRWIRENPGAAHNSATRGAGLSLMVAPQHFAAFPTEWPRRLILGWTPPGICTACGQGRRPATAAAEYEPAGHGQRDDAARRRRMPGDGRDPLSRHGETASTLRTIAARTITAHVCGCPTPSAPTRPAVVLDPLGGTGTTALVASVLGRVGISVDLSRDYCRLARWRTTDPRQRAKAGRRPAPAPELAGQVGLFDAAEGG